MQQKTADKQSMADSSKWLVRFLGTSFCATLVREKPRFIILQSALCIHVCICVYVYVYLCVSVCVSLYVSVYSIAVCVGAIRSCRLLGYPKPGRECKVSMYLAFV